MTWNVHIKNISAKIAKNEGILHRAYRPVCSSGFLH